MTDAWMAQAVCFALHATDDTAVGRAERRVRSHLARPPRRHSGLVRIKVRSLTCAFMLREYASPNMSLLARVSVAVQGWANVADMRRRRHRTCVPVLDSIKFRVYITINSQSVQHTTLQRITLRKRAIGLQVLLLSGGRALLALANGHIVGRENACRQQPLNESQCGSKVRSA